MTKGVPREFRDETTVSARTKPGTALLPAMLRVISPEPLAGEFRLAQGTCTVGAGKQCDLIINHRAISRVHAELTLVPEGVLVHDLGSRNGTFYLGQRIGALVLGLGARIQLGGGVTLALEPDTETLLTGPDTTLSNYRGILGKSERLRRMFALLERLESSLATVLIEGESGVGKEGVARAIHDGSPVAAGRMVPVNCGAIPPGLVASELFGHRKGAFTGASENRRGAFELAHGGTLFLDEVGELPLDMQPSLLRAIELGEIRPVGTDETHSVKVRVIAATNRDLEAEVAAGRFRQDVFFRLAVVRVQVPPLRARVEDIELLAQHFAKTFDLEELPRDVIDDLKRRPLAGNVRELKNAIQSYAAIGQLPVAPASTEVPSHLALIDPTVPYADQKDAVVDRFTKEYLKVLLRYANGNQAAAARIAKIDRTHLGRLMTKYGIHVRKFE